MRRRQAQTGDKGIAYAALTMACIGVFFTALDQTVVVTALPPIIGDLNVGATKLDQAAWIVSAYLLGFVIAMPLMGRVSDIYGRRRIFLLCLGIFGTGSILCGLAPVFARLWDLGFLHALSFDTSSPGLIWLIAARFIQAIGGGAVVPVAMAIASDFYGLERRGLALGIIGAVTEAGGVVGPLYGAIIVQQLGWQYIFFLNVPIVIALMVAAWKLIPRGNRLHEGVDWPGVILLGLALTCLSLGLAQQGSELGPTRASSPAPHNNPLSLALALVFLLAFVLVERRARWPVVELSLFKRPPFSATSLLSLLVGAALITAMVDIPIFVDSVLQLPVLDSGLALLRLTAMIPAGALVGGWLSNRFTCRFIGVLGLLYTAAGFYLMSRWLVNANWTQITLSTITAGFGFGLVIAPIGTTALNAVKARQAGMGSAVVTSLRMVGMTLGLAGLTSWALAYFKQLVSTYPSLPPSAARFADWAQGYAIHIIAAARAAYSAVFFSAMILCLIAIVPALFLWGNKVAAREQELPGTRTQPAPAQAPLEAEALSAVALADSGRPAPEPVPPASHKGGKYGLRWRLHRAAAAILLLSLLVIAGVVAAFMWQTPSTTASSLTGRRMLLLALDQGALSSLFVSQLGLHNGAFTDLQAVPVPGDGLILRLDLHIDANGIHRVMPVDIDSTLGIDAQQNIQLTVQRLRRDGRDAGPAATASMQQAINQMLKSALMPSLRGQLQGVKIISVHTSSSIGCASRREMLVLLLQTPPTQGAAAQRAPISFCLQGAIAIHQFLP